MTPTRLALIIIASMRRRRFLQLLGFGAAAVGGAAPASAVAFVDHAHAFGADERRDNGGSFRGQQTLVWSCETTEPVIALTFDDGPDPAFTPTVLDVLAARGASATFFAVGANVDAYPDLVRRAAAEGHELANHSRTHRNPVKLDAATTAAEITGGADALEALTGLRPTWYRPPRGNITGAVMREAARTGAKVALWSFARGPATDDDVEGVRAHLTAMLSPGAVIDLHDGVNIVGRSKPHSVFQKLTKRRTAEVAALPGVLDAAIAGGFRFVTLSQMCDQAGAASGQPAPAP